MEKIKRVLNDSSLMMIIASVGFIVIAFIVFIVNILSGYGIHGLYGYISTYGIYFTIALILLILIRNKIITNKIPMYIAFAISVFMALRYIYILTYIFESIPDVSIYDVISIIISLLYLMIVVFLGLSMFENKVSNKIYDKLYLGSIGAIIVSELYFLGNNIYGLIKYDYFTTISSFYDALQIINFILAPILATIFVTGLIKYFKENKR